VTGTEQEQLLQLERQVLTHTGQTTTNYVVPGGYIKTTKKVPVYEKPGVKKMATVAKGSIGTVVGDPRLIKKVIWWRVQFDTTIGWVRESEIERIASVTLSFDYNEDLLADAAIRLIGNYDVKKFVIEHERENAYMLVRYTGDRPSVRSPRVFASLATSSTSYSKTDKKRAQWGIQWYVEGLPKDGYTTFQIETVRTTAFSGSGGGSVEGWEITSDFITGLHYIDLNQKLTPDPGVYKSRVSINHCSGYRPYGCGEGEEKIIAISDWLSYTINN
ncbi:MAG: hypothetical protein RLZZ70_105, partial [Candidatus Parcubacteria bacterium]